MLTLFDLHLGHQKSSLKRITAQYAQFSSSKWSATHNTLSEILNNQIPYEVQEGRYGLRSKKPKKEIDKYIRNHPNFPAYD